jgi:hypothetical protein
VILVTGGAGYIGSHACVALLSAGEEVESCCCSGVISRFSQTKPFFDDSRSRTSPVSRSGSVAVRSSIARAQPEPAPDAPPPNGWWDSVLSDPRASGKSWIPIQQRRLSEIPRELLRVECLRCFRTVEITREIRHRGGWTFSLAGPPSFAITSNFSLGGFINWFASWRTMLPYDRLQGLSTGLGTATIGRRG